MDTLGEASSSRSAGTPAVSSRWSKSLRDRLQPVEAELAVVSALHQRAASLESHVIARKPVHGIVGAAGKV